MSDWLRTVIGIVLFKAGPQDLPGSRSSLVLAVLVYATVALTVSMATGSTAGYSPMLLSFGLQLVLIVAVLQFNHRMVRFNQTASALFATAALLSLVNLPLWLLAEPPLPSNLAVLILAGLFWSLAVDGSIWRHALDRSFGFGLAIAVLLFVINFAIMQSVTPAANSA
ncbi:MAG: hypothetical protein AAGH65_11255 [Pseudomonadota bacterium]